MVSVSEKNLKRLCKAYRDFYDWLNGKGGSDASHSDLRRVQREIYNDEGTGEIADCGDYNDLNGVVSGLAKQTEMTAGQIYRIASKMVK